MDWGLLEIIVVVAITVLSAVGGLIARAIQRNSQRIDDLDGAHSAHMTQLRSEARKQIREIEIQLESKVERHDRQIASLEASQITHEDLGRIYRRVEPMPTAIAEVKGEVKSMHGTLQLIQKLMMEKAS